MIISLCIALLCIPSIAYGGHLQKNAQQMHSKINFLLQNLDQVLPQQSIQEPYDPSNIPMKQDASLTVDEVKNFIGTVHEKSQKIQALQEQYQQQQELLNNCKRIIERLKKLTHWFYLQHSINAWLEYATIHQQTYTTIASDLKTLSTYAEFQDLCKQLCQVIFNGVSIMIIQSHKEIPNTQQQFKLLHIYLQFEELCKPFQINAFPAVDNIVKSIQNKNHR